MANDELGLFRGRDRPDVETVWSFYQKGLNFNNQINLDETVKANRNFVVGKQWEGVQANGLPTPQFNILKRVVSFVIATNTTDNIKVNVTALANTPNTDSLAEPVRVVNEEFDALNEANDIPALAREFARNAAVDGDGCTYTYWDPDVNCGGGVMGAIKTEIISNTRVFFGNPNDRQVQTQPYIQIANREIVRLVKKRAKENKVPDWEQIKPDSEENNDMDSSKITDDKVTVLLTLWRDDDTGEIWAYESTQNCEVRKPWSLGIKMYPICWLNWDYIQDCYHGQAMVTGLIPNQIFINKAFAMSMLSMMRSAWPKILYDKTRVSKWDNRVGGTIGVNGGDINSVAKILDPAQISPQISQFIELAIAKTEESLGATASALGEGKAYNTSAILSLQRAAATPSELTKQNLYKAIEDQFRIYLEFMANYYGKRTVDIETPPETAEAMAFAGMPAQESLPMPFDFSILKDYPMMLKLDVGGSTYYSEMASMQTLDNLLQSGQITLPQYLERIPDSYIPKRRALINELKQQMGMAAGMPPQPDMGGGGGSVKGSMLAQLTQDPEISGGRGYGAVQRQINREAGM